MDIQKIPAGKHVPDDINVIIEIPARSDAVKYEVDKSSGALMVDRFMTAAMYYPCNYGYIPNTLAEDGDPMDVLVMTPAPIISGAIINCRPIALLQMTDESGPDAKILAVPNDKLSKLYQTMKEPQDVPATLLATIKHFFEHYKDLEEGKWVKVEEWQDSKEAKQQIIASIQRYQKA